MSNWRVLVLAVYIWNMGLRELSSKYFTYGLTSCLTETLGTRFLVFACLVMCAGDGVDLMVNGEDRAQVWDLVARRSGGRVRSRAIHHLHTSQDKQTQRLLFPRSLSDNRLVHKWNIPNLIYLSPPFKFKPPTPKHVNYSSLRLNHGTSPLGSST